MNINIRQNSMFNLKRLAAQRQLYSDAKRMLCVQFIVSILAVIILGIIGNTIPKDYSIYTTLVAILCLFFDELYLSKQIEGLKYSAALIQEEFDCEVLQIPKNRMKEDYGSMLETIQEKNKKFINKGNDYKLLKDWYPGVEGADTRYGKIICQSTNCWWNQQLRKRYSVFLIAIISITFMILLLVSLANGISLNSFIGSVFAPILPGAVLVYRITSENKKSIYNLNHMKKKLDEIIERLKLKEAYPEGKLKSDVRSLQDMIFENRWSSPLIPDKFYSKHRAEDEQTAEDTNKALVDLMEILNE